ncbi:hypothetical protein IQ268_15640 [Oculatella sp. LEGE 06141]|uniref:hypothetical protein n=1 Tax=Oculatella sp. LEGE 06141 TaxID=1828648 RepID=UPI00187EC037|nr:hypothetical protein [Oculatella sp. LEGE 06141]MBE9180002.1 hypothetical protein [Oculatella sp. LEGE 06141]
MKHDNLIRPTNDSNPLPLPFPALPGYWNAVVKKLKQTQFWHGLVQTCTIPSELQVSWKNNLRGQSYLEVFDPLTQKHHRFGSEQDALIWIERQRFNQ